MKYDYIIVGSGLASIMFAEQLRLYNKSFIIISNRSQQASVVASGLYNPVVLKRFTATWNAAVHLETAIPKYAALEQLLSRNPTLGILLRHSISIDLTEKIKHKE